MDYLAMTILSVVFFLLEEPTVERKLRGLAIVALFGGGVSSIYAFSESLLVHNKRNIVAAVAYGGVAVLGLLLWLPYQIYWYALMVC